MPNLSHHTFYCHARCSEHPEWLRHGAERAALDLRCSEGDNSGDGASS